MSTKYYSPCSLHCVRLRSYQANPCTHRHLHMRHRVFWSRVHFGSNFSLSVRIAICYGTKLKSSLLAFTVKKISARGVKLLLNWMDVKWFFPTHLLMFFRCLEGEIEWGWWVTQLGENPAQASSLREKSKQMKNLYGAKQCDRLTWYWEAFYFFHFFHIFECTLSFWITESSLELLCEKPTVISADPAQVRVPHCDGNLMVLLWWSCGAFNRSYVNIHALLTYYSKVKQLSAYQKWTVTWCFYWQINTFLLCEKWRESWQEDCASYPT